LLWPALAVRRVVVACFGNSDDGAPGHGVDGPDGGDGADVIGFVDVFDVE
jgi:hypothetical protein